MSEKEIFKRIPGLQKAEDGEDISISDPVFGISFEYDRKVGTVYVRLGQVGLEDEKVDRTEVVTENCSFDLDKYGSVVGIEILNAKKWIKQYLDKMING